MTPSAVDCLQTASCHVQIHSQFFSAPPRQAQSTLTLLILVLFLFIFMRSLFLSCLSQHFQHFQLELLSNPACAPPPPAQTLTFPSHCPSAHQKARAVLDTSCPLAPYLAAASPAGAPECSWRVFQMSHMSMQTSGCGLQSQLLQDLPKVGGVVLGPWPPGGSCAPKHQSTSSLYFKETAIQVLSQTSILKRVK